MKLKAEILGPNIQHPTSNIQWCPIGQSFDGGRSMFSFGSGVQRVKLSGRGSFSTTSAFSLQPSAFSLPA